MSERTFSLVDPNLISCNTPCGREFAVSVEGGKFKELGGLTRTFRCTANKSPLRGQHYGLPGRQEHLSQLTACRVCTLYTNSAETDLQDGNTEPTIDNIEPQA